MSRFLENPFEDFKDSAQVKIDENEILKLIKKYISDILENTKPKTSQEGDRRADLYVGDAGIAFMLLKLSQSNKLKNLYPALEFCKTYLQSAENNIKKSRPEKQFSFLGGNAGVFALLVALSSVLNEQDQKSKYLKEYVKGIPYFKQIDSEDTLIPSELFVGRAGYICGLNWMEQILKDRVVPENDHLELVESLYESGKFYAEENHLAVPLMYNYHDREYLGAAHGVSFILLTLLESPWFKKYPEILNENFREKIAAVKTTIDAILQLQNYEGNFPSKFNKDEYHLVHWCHGAPGVIYLMAKAFLVFKEQKYLDSCLKAGDLIWEKGLLLKGPGVCHGVAGSGYAFLLLYRLTNDQKHLYRAIKFAEFLTNERFLRKARTPDRPYSLYEGLAGTVCFLADLLEPENASFPFMDIFK